MTTTSSSAPAVAVDLSDLERHLKSRLSLAWECLELTEGDPGATAATVNTARMEMGKLKKEVAETREDIRRWREMIKKVQYLASFLHSANASLERVSADMAANPRLAAMSNNSNNSSSSNNNSSDSQKEAKGQEKESLNGKQQQSNPQKQQQKPPPPTAQLSFLTVSEFDSVPKYMRGRLTYDSVNAAVGEYNRALEEKYSFLRRGFKSTASIKDKKRYKEFRAQETRETRGVHFLVAEDLRGSEQLKSEAGRRAVFTILRHCQRIREMRRPGAPIKYAVAK